MSEIENMIIIGSGPAAHCAAIYAARAELKPLLFEGFNRGGVPGGQLMTTTEVENYPGFTQGIEGPALMQQMRAQSLRFGTRFLTHDVERVELQEHPFKVHCSDTGVHQTRTLVVATGASARYLGLSNEKRLMNAGVSACATCDGALPAFRNQPVAVVGGGDTAMEEALFLTRFASQVLLVHRRTSLRASHIMQERVRAHPKIVLQQPFEVDDILGKAYVEAIQLRHSETGAKQTHPVAGIFIAIGHKPNSDLFTGQLEMDQVGYLKTRGKSAYTNVAGVFACGDVQDHVYRQAITAAGSGCQAAIDAERWLAAGGRSDKVQQEATW